MSAHPVRRASRIVQALLGGCLLVAGAAQAASVDLSITQCEIESNPTTRGDVVTFTLPYENGSSAEATKPSIHIPLPPTTEYVSAAPSECALDAVGNVVICNFERLEGNRSGEVSLQLRTTATTPSNIVSNVELKLDPNHDTDPRPGNNVKDCKVTIDNGADLSAEMTSVESVVPGGGYITWKINGKNLGPNPASGQTFVTELPTTLKYLSFQSGAGSGSPWQCSSVGQRVTCNRSDSLAVDGAYPELSIKTELSHTVAIGHMMLSGNISSNTADPLLNNNDPTHIVTVEAGADLGVDVTVIDAQVIPGGTVNYALKAFNNGPSAANKGLDVTFQLPAGFTPVGVPTPPGAVCSWSGDVSTGQLLTCEYTSSYNRDWSETIQVQATAPLVTVPTEYNDPAHSKASIKSKAGGPTDPRPNNDNDRKNVMVTPAGAVDLAFTKSKAPSPVALGGEITSTFNVTNEKGPYAADAGSITLTDVLNDDQEKFTGVVDGPWTCTEHLGVPKVGQTSIVCTNDASIPVKGSSQFSIKTTAKTAGKIINAAKLEHSGNWNPNKDNIISAEVTATETNNSPDLAIKKEVDAPVLSSQESGRSYTLTVTNNSSHDATDLVITDYLPDFLLDASKVIIPSTISASGLNGSDASFSCDRNQRTITCTQDSGVLKETDDVILTIGIARPLVGSPKWTNKATVYSTTQGDPNPANNIASVDLEIEPIADLQMVSKIASPNPAQAGVLTTYILTFKNNGPDTSENVVVKDDFILQAGEPGFTFVSAEVMGNGGGSCTGLIAESPYTAAGRYTIECSGFSLQSAEQRTVEVVVRPHWSKNNGGAITLRNQARVYSLKTPESVSGPVGDIGVDDSVTRGVEGNFATVDLPVQAAELNVLIVTNDKPSAAGPDPVGFTPAPQPGTDDNKIKYLVRISNQGPSLATGVAFTYTMEPQESNKTMRFDGPVPGSDLSCLPTAGAITTPNTPLEIKCELTGAAAQLAAGRSIDNYLTFSALEIPTDGGYIVDTKATVTVNEFDNNLDDDTDKENTTIRVRSNIAIVVPDQGPVEVHEPFDWVFKVTNLGPGNSSITSLTNTLHDDMQFIATKEVTWNNANDSSSGTCTKNNQGLTCNFGKVSSLADVIVTAPVRFVKYPTNGSLQNCASATTNEVDPDSTNNVSACGSATVVRSSIAGVVFEDNNDDGQQDTNNEKGIKDAKVTLSGKDAYGNAVSITLQTDANGKFLFNNQNGGAQNDPLGYLNSADGAGYTLTQALPAGYFDGKDTLGTAGGVPSQDSTTASTDLVTGIMLEKNTLADDKITAKATGYQFGEIKTASLSGRVCVDSNDNGVCEATESGIRGVRIDLSGKDSSGADACKQLPTCTATTDADGAYSFAVTASDPNGFTLTQEANNSIPLNAFADGKDSAGTLNGTLNGTVNNNPAGSDSISNIVVLPDQQGINYDFGERGSSLSGLVYLDSSDDGKRDPDEPGIPGVKVTVSGKTPDGLDICPPANPSLLPLAACTAVTGPDGSYSFSGLPNGTYTVTEEQPTGYEDGKDTAGIGGGTPGAVGTDTISNVTINGKDVDGYLFGEKADVAAPGSAMVSGKVWFESSSRDKTQNSGERGLEGWQVEARNATGLLIATATTDHNGAYEFDLPAGEYSLAFHHPVSGALYGTPEAQDPGSNNGKVDPDARTITVKVNGGANIVEQNLPVDPSGVVYDAVTRQPVPGAMVEISGPAGFDPAADMVGGTAAAKQMTGADGFYQFFLKPSAPSGDYSLLVTAPAGYLQAPSELIPVCQTLLTVGTAGAPQLVQNGAEAPGAGVPAHDPISCPSVSGGLGVGSHTTQYYFRFNLNSGSDDVINNHIPLDPILGGAIVMTKTTPKVNVTRGELVPYTLTARNTLTVTLNNIVIEDQIPPGFKYVKGSAQIDGVPVEPELEGRRLRFPERTLNGGQTVVIKMLLVVGSGVGFNEYVNQTWALNSSANSRVSNVASATVRVVADPTFDCSDLIGTVYDDQNRNGYQDQGEPGIAGARVATPKGWLVTSDQHGRFHIACADVPSEMRGSNFILKADERSLPSGYRITTENPRVVRMTQGRLVKANFGASIHRVVRLDLNSEAFGADHQLIAAYQERLAEVLTLLYAEPSILRIAYHMPVEGEVSDARKRVGNVRSWFKKQWEPNDCCYDLQLEEEIVPVADNMEVIQ